MSVSQLKDHAWRRATVELLPPPARALFDAIVQFTPDDIVADAERLTTCKNALCSALMHPSCPEACRTLLLSREQFLAFMTDFTTKSLRDSNDLFEVHIDMLAQRAGFDPRELPTVARLFESAGTRACMHRYIGGLAVAYVYGTK